jgi:hypothetical protein
VGDEGVKRGCESWGAFEAEATKMNMVSKEIFLFVLFFLFSNVFMIELAEL